MVSCHLDIVLHRFRADKTRRVTGDILNYALTLEHLEDKFYREGLANFTQAQFAAAGFDATFYNNLKEVSNDETTHVNFLTSALTGMSSNGTHSRGID